MPLLHKPVFATAAAVFVSLSAFAWAGPATCFSTQTGALATVASPLQSVDNSHLNNPDARILLRLELEALKKAIMANDAAETRRHLTNAVIFRKYRYQLYPEGAKAENEAELSQGILSYNDMEVSRKKVHEVSPYLVASLNKLIADGNYADYFATQTVPMYGFILKQANKNWQKDIKTLTTFTELVISEVNLKIPADVKSAAKRLERSYDGPAITAKENARTATAE